VSLCLGSLSRPSPALAPRVHAVVGWVALVLALLGWVRDGVGWIGGGGGAAAAC
jgi:hypothetical protein